MESARFQLIGGVRTAGRLDPPWPVVDDSGHRFTPGLVPNDLRPVVDDVPWVGWRLLSRNHRDLARSPQVFATAEACVASVERLRSVVDEAGTVIVRNLSDRRWSWQLRTPDGIVAVASRGYLRDRECHVCVAQVVELVPVALPPDADAVLYRRSRGALPRARS